ncbi:SCO3374 family protein [Streptomyces sp. NPDC003691]
MSAAPPVPTPPPSPPPRVPPVPLRPLPPRGALPAPRRPLGRPDRSGPAGADVAHWYETRLGWRTAAGAGPGAPAQLLTGLDFDVLELPAAAGAAVLRRAAAGVRTGPVALHGDLMRLLVAAGAAEEVPGLLAWLEWGGVALDLTAVGAGGRMAAPLPPRWTGSRGAAVWLRPPAPGREPESELPGLPGSGADGHPGRLRGPDLVRLLDTVATECHRARLLRTNTRTGPPTGTGYVYEYAACEYAAD